MNPIRAICIFAPLLAVQANVSGITEGSCLLQKDSNVQKVRPHRFQSFEVQNLHSNWRSQRKLMLADTSESMDVLEQFIQKQDEAGDACSARLLESKRVLDGLLADLKSLSTQVDSHEEVLETETENLNITEISVKAVEAAHEEALAECDQEQQDAADVVSQYQAELAELDQIAKPSVRYSHVTTVSKDSATVKEGIVEESSLLQDGQFTKEACFAFLQLQRKKKHHKHARLNSTNNETEPEEDDKDKCDQEREELQKAFTEAYITTRNLLKQAEKDVKDTVCVETADAKKAAALVPLIAQREHAASLIETSTQSLAALDPILDLVDRRVEKISSHIYDVLTPECAEAKEVSEALTKIRQLILLLEECPGRNDFKLKIPEEAVEEIVVTPAPAPAPEENEGPEKTEEYIKKAKSEEDDAESGKEANEPEENNNNNNDNNDDNNNDNNNNNNNNNNEVPSAITDNAVN